MERRRSEECVFAAGREKANGLLTDNDVRDKDGAVAALLLAEVVGRLQALGKNAYAQRLRQFRPLRLPYGRHD